MSERKILSDEERRQLGKSGKLWSIEVFYYGEFNSVRKIEIRNRTNDEIWQFRDYVFRVGIMFQETPIRWRVIPPQDIKDVFLYLQKNFIGDL